MSRARGSAATKKGKEEASTERAGKRLNLVESAAEPFWEINRLGIKAVGERFLSEGAKGKVGKKPYDKAAGGVMRCPIKGEGRDARPHQTRRNRPPKPASSAKSQGGGGVGTNATDSTTKGKATLPNIFLTEKNRGFRF